MSSSSCSSRSVSPGASYEDLSTVEVGRDTPGLPAGPDVARVRPDFVLKERLCDKGSEAREEFWLCRWVCPSSTSRDGSAVKSAVSTTPAAVKAVSMAERLLCRKECAVLEMWMCLV